MTRAWLIPVAALGAIGILLWSQRAAGPFFVSGIIEADEIRVGSRVGGRVREVKVIEGQRVAPGTPLVMLEPFDTTERLAEARATLAARRAMLSRFEAGFRPEEIAQARARRDRYRATLEKLVAGKRPLELQILRDKLEVARAELANASTEFDRLKKIREQNLGAEKEWSEVVRAQDTARARFTEAENELKLAEEGTRAEEIAEARAWLAETEQNLAMMEKGSRSEEIAEARAMVDSAVASVAVIQRQTDELTIAAPSDCVVEAIDLQPGDLIAPNAPMITLVDPQRLWVRAYLPENRLNVAIGDKVSLAVDSYPGRRFAGQIVFVARQAEFTPSNTQTTEERSKQVFRIKVAIDEGRDVLRAGMSVDVYFGPAK